jgi:hypothetical protein
MTSIRSLDPVDPNAPPPDGSRVLESVLATPPPARRQRTAARLLPLVPVGLVVALVIGLIAVLVSVGDRSDEELVATGGSTGGAIIHYVVRERFGAPEGSLIPGFTDERWQREDGSRARIVTHYDAAGPLHGTESEDVLTSSESLAYRPAVGGQPARIIRYRATDDFASVHEEPPPFGAPAIGGSSAVGDPRSVPQRMADGDTNITPLPDATVRGIAVKQFQVGDCRGSTGQQATVALARDTLAPVRVTHEACQPDGALSKTRVLDYLSFEELDPTPENLKLLDLSARPGVPIVDGIDIDKAEQRQDAGPAPTATPTPERSGP